MQRLPRTIKRPVGEEIDMLLRLVREPEVVSSYPKLSDRHCTIGIRTCLIINVVTFFLRQVHHTFGIGYVALLQGKSVVRRLENVHLRFGQRMSAPLVQHHHFQMLIGHFPMYHLQGRHVHQSSSYDVRITLGRSHHVIDSRFQRRHLDRHRLHPVIGSRRNADLRLTHESAILLHILRADLGQ